MERTDDWYAQDRRGNIWYLGERTIEFANGGQVSTEGSFEAGVDGARGVGPVLTLGVSGGADREELVTFTDRS